MKVATTSVPALERGLDVLELLNQVPEGLGISELAARLSLNKNSVFRITHTLTDRNYLERDPLTKRFRLSTKFLTLGLPQVGDVSLVEEALPFMRELRDATRETVQLGIRVGDEGVIIEQVSGLHPLRIAVDIGLRFPLHNNAPGKTLLAFQNSEEVASTIDRIPLTADTSRTITDPKVLLAECDRIRSCRYASDYAEADEGIHCVAAPITGCDENLIAVVWVSAPSKRMPKGVFSSVGKQVLQCADKIAGRLGR
ncbi:MAG: IclR family transcriptional regulator [Planctomycetes bacterium]|nr:IclR family transcriptional regulator [Planctomycetota bacterium]MCH9778795.1 IclR family transcriptional regulator [Planctomycetota bacterium]MCH9793572.1 IclR family transcriptional regulator [Planctomycetota bacterium]